MHGAGIGYYADGDRLEGRGRTESPMATTPDTMPMEIGRRRRTRTGTSMPTAPCTPWCCWCAFHGIPLCTCSSCCFFVVWMLCKVTVAFFKIDCSVVQVLLWGLFVVVVVPGPLKIYQLWDEILGTFRPNQGLGGIQAWYVNAKDAHKILRTEKLAVVPEIQPFLWYPFFGWWPIFQRWKGNFQST